MNSRLRLARWFTVLVCIAGSAPRVHAQFLFSHDASGNLTNAVANSTTAPSTTVQGGGQTIFAGDALSLTATAKGSGPLSYQWRHNGTDITDATNATFFIANASAADAGTYTVVVSNGVGAQTNQVGDISVLATTNTLYGIAYALNQYIAVGENGIIVGSSNLLAWFVRSSGTTNSLRGITFGGNTFVAVGANATVLTSTNGLNWVAQNSGNTNDLNGVAYGTNTFVAVGSGGTTLTSSNGIAWVTRSFDYLRLEAVAHANGWFVAVGSDGAIWRSVLGVSWTTTYWPTSSDLKSIGFGNGKYIAVGENGLILSSSDAATWTAQSSGTEQSLESVLFFNNTLFALGPVGNNLVSANGASWNESPSGTFDPLFGSSVGNSIAVAVGANGAMVRIPYSVLDHYEWSTIPSPQRVNQAFSATVTAKDAASNTISNYGGAVSLSAVVLQSTSTNMILGNVAQTGYYIGTNLTAGYTFTPSLNFHGQPFT